MSRSNPTKKEYAQTRLIKLAWNEGEILEAAKRKFFLKMRQSGKGVPGVIPLLNNFPGSKIVLDFKGEEEWKENLSNKTAKRAETRRLLGKEAF